MHSDAIERRLLQRQWFIWFLLACFWMTLSVVGTWVNHNQYIFSKHPITWHHAGMMNLVAYGSWALVLTPLILLICWYFPLERGRLGRAIPVHLVGMFSMGVVESLIRLPFCRFLCPDLISLSPWQRFRGEVFVLMEADIWMYLAVVGVLHVLLYYSRFKDRELKAARLEAQLASTELQLLKMQLHPHFLFNTLHTIAAMMHKDVRRAEQMIMQLGDLLRLTLEGVNVEEVTLKREVDFLQRYLDIQQVRFQERLQVNIDIQPNTWDACVPYLLLQPLVENAVQHGIARRSLPGRIEIFASRENGHLLLSIRNDGPPANGGGVVRSGGMGLSNTRARLRRLYGPGHDFTMEHLATGCAEVQVRIPFKSAPAVEQPAHVFSAAD